MLIDYVVREFPFEGANELHISEQINTEVCRLSADPLGHFVRCPDTVVRVAIAGVNPGHGLVVIFERTKGHTNMKDNAVFQQETNRQIADLTERLDKLEKPGNGPPEVRKPNGGGKTPAEQLEASAGDPETVPVDPRD